MFTGSILINDRDVMAAKEVIEGKRQELLNVLAGLRLHHAEAALEIGMQIRADMNLTLTAWRLDGFNWGSRSRGDRFSRDGGHGALAPAGAFKLLLNGGEL
jgi:hypothetical protein